MGNEFEEGVLVGLLVGEGHFGGDGRQPQVTLRMHERHEALFRWLERTFPGGRLYGPYDHGGRRYYQWMARGAFLREELVPLLQRAVTPSLDRYAHARLTGMVERYDRQLGVRSEQEPDEPIPGEEPARSPDRGTAPPPQDPTSAAGAGPAAAAGGPAVAGVTAAGAAVAGGPEPAARAAEIFAALRSEPTRGDGGGEGP